ncbi:MAG TPA: hypothetical protein VFS97_00765 [Nitrososphaeraceae archaeon]|nr:hypothetical protein [Nitrososphaeraceae archaeon]
MHFASVQLKDTWRKIERSSGIEEEKEEDHEVIPHSYKGLLL